MTVCEHNRTAKRHPGWLDPMTATLAAAATVMYSCRSARVTIHFQSLLPFPECTRFETVEGLCSQIFVALAEGFLNLGVSAATQRGFYRWVSEHGTL